MSGSFLSNGRNRLLASLSADDEAAVQALGDVIELPVRQVLVTPDTPVEHVYFLTGGVASVVAQGDRPVEVGIYGRDGLSAPFLPLGTDRTPHEHFIQVEGAGLRVPAVALGRLIQGRPAVKAQFLLYAQTFAVQTAQTAVANGAYSVLERLARWLLMCDDRVDGESMPLTHEFLGLMLAVRRSSVTLALQSLEGKGLIRASRARIMLLDRGRLEGIAGDSYGVPEAEYQRLIGSLR